MAIPPGVVRFTEPFLDTFLPVPPVQPGVCRLCHGAADPGNALCWSCRKTAAQVTRPVGEIVPICLCEAHGQLRYLLRQYKDGPPKLRRRLRPRVAGLVGRFLAEHAQCLGPWGLVTTVASGQSRQGTHPLVSALHMLPLRSCHRRLLHADPAAPRGEHLSASDDRFTLTQGVADARILLIDDTFTSGAALQSAASRLRLAGAQVTAVVLGRYVKPEYSKQLLARSRARQPSSLAGKRRLRQRDKVVAVGGRVMIKSLVVAQRVAVERTRHEDAYEGLQVRNRCVPRGDHHWMRTYTRDLGIPDVSSRDQRSLWARHAAAENAARRARNPSWTRSGAA